MYGPALFTGLLLLLSSLVSNFIAQSVLHQERAETQLVAGQLPAYGLYVERYAAANPTVAGEVASGDIGLPAWFTPMTALHNRVQGGVAYVYVVPASLARGNTIIRLVGGRPRLGLATGGFLKRPDGPVSTIAVPAEIPEGALVMVM